MSNKLEWVKPNYRVMNNKVVKSGRNYFPGYESVGNAVAITPSAAFCSQIANPAISFTPAAAAICNGTATTNAAPGADGVFDSTAGPLSPSQCGMVNIQSDSYLYDTWGDDLQSGDIDFNFDTTVNFCS